MALASSTFRSAPNSHPEPSGRSWAIAFLSLPLFLIIWILIDAHLATVETKVTASQLAESLKRNEIEEAKQYATALSSEGFSEKILRWSGFRKHTHQESREFLTDGLMVLLNIILYLQNSDGNLATREFERIENDRPELLLSSRYFRSSYYELKGRLPYMSALEDEVYEIREKEGDLQEQINEIAARKYIDKNDPNLEKLRSQYKSLEQKDRELQREVKAASVGMQEVLKENVASELHSSKLFQ